MDSIIAAATVEPQLRCGQDRSLRVCQPFTYGEKMKKALIAVIVVLGLAAASMPFVNGMLAEKGFRRLVEEVNTIYADQGYDLKVEVVRFDRGFSSSEVEWKIGFGKLKSLYGIEEIVLLDRGRHGFRSVEFVTSLERNPWYADFVGRQPGGVDPLAIRTTYTLDGGIRSVISLQPMTFTVEKDAGESKAAELVFLSDWELKRIQASGTWGGLIIADKLNVEGVSFNTDLRPISSFLWDGGGTIHVGKLSGRDADVELSMDGLRTGYGISYDETNKTIDIESSYGVGRISDGSEQLENGSATIGVRGLDAAAYEEAMKTYTRLVGEVLKELETAGDDPEALEQVVTARMNSIGMQMIGLMEKFLKPGLEIFVSDLHAGLSQGEVRGEATLRLEKQLSFAQLLPVSQQPEQLFEYVTFHSDVRLPAALVGENPLLLEPAYPGMKTGLFVREGSDLVSRSETRERKLFLNNEQIVFN